MRERQGLGIWKGLGPESLNTTGVSRDVQVAVALAEGWDGTEGLCGWETRGLAPVPGSLG